MGDNLDDFTVVVASYGNWYWWDLGKDRAIPSIESQVNQVIQVHLSDGTLAQARNAGLEKVETEYVIFVDADDELEPKYIEMMAQGTADLRGPRVRYGPDAISWMPQVVGKHGRHTHRCQAECLREGNWLVIGTCARTELMRKVGWKEYALFEDWAMFAEMWKNGATVEGIDGAVYLAHTRPNSRNQGDQAMKLRVFEEIERNLWA